ncbi:MAG: lyase family protein [Patescibacteria group bacterium]|nr:lyase family protein [Patescibacteria group bacterium]
MALPGYPRYQPKELVPYFGYDNLMRWMVEVELAAMKTLAEAGAFDKGLLDLITPEMHEKLVGIPTTYVDKIEREKTKHDIRALVLAMKEILPAPLHPWVHVPLTSYDVVDTARSLMFREAHREVIRPRLKDVIRIFAKLVENNAHQVQIGRTHGQHALPITVGFWLATVLQRFVFNAKSMDEWAEELRGKISGAVGAHNAQVALGFARHGRFEDIVLEKLQMIPAAISTQILPPEPMANYLFSTLLCSGAFAQFGRDARHLMRSEINEVAEAFEAGQVGSSTMAHKRNPINFENMEGMFTKNRNEFGKVMDTLISEHQRDLTGSSVYRDFPIMVINLYQQISTLLRKNAAGVTFLERLTVDGTACGRNMAMAGDKILAEPLYIAMQMAGYPGDAHKLINERAMTVCKEKDVSLLRALDIIGESDVAVFEAFDSIPPETMELFRDPSRYIGDAAKKTEVIVCVALDYINSIHWKG